ncbi:MAG: HNH endonuclease domain-containing protein, partial [Elusimicrobiales bacterium]|nr:HNH endonuclease domain-containing protein [Elusimicrobiales bacterium]
KNIGFEQAFDENQTQVDHIIPQRGEIAGPNVFENKVLVFKDQNKEKSNRLPYEWKFKNDIDAYREFTKTNKAK